MIRKTDKRFKRRSKVWARGYATEETCVDVVRRETWWLAFIPLYVRETIIGNTM